MDIQFQQIVPIPRIFDVAKAGEFCLGFLGFVVDWDHRFHDNAPLYRQIHRGDLVLHLSEHHGDGSPGARLRVRMTGIDAFVRELGEKKYRYMNSGLEDTPRKPAKLACSTRSAIRSALPRPQSALLFGSR
jgi:hypothetical protein